MRHLLLTVIILALLLYGHLIPAAILFGSLTICDTIIKCHNSHMKALAALEARRSS
jgi:hypothetical protein